MLGPVPSGSEDAIGPVWWMLYGTVAVLLISSAVRLFIRDRRIRQYAARTGYAYVGDQLPADFPLLKSFARNASKIQAAVWGESCGQRFLFFDCTLGSGKGRLRRTVIAVCGPRESFGAERLDPALALESIDSWTLLYRRRGLLSPEEIQAIVSSL